MSRRRYLTFLPAALALSALLGCKPVPFTEAEKKAVASLSLSSLPPLPADPSNRYADEPAAAALGATLFFDQRLSRNGDVACSTCHLADRQFQDDRPLGVGISTTSRRTMPLADVARSPFLFWDGRRDSLWAQALGPLEDAREHGGTRAAYAHFVKDNFAARYAPIFGPLPDLSDVPASASPLGGETEKVAWAAMSEAQQEAVNRVFADIGKAIAAFERSIVHEKTRFDRFAEAVASGVEPEGDAALTDEEFAGLRLFVGKANCIECHNGPRFTDDHFHNTGIPPADGLSEDLGRQAGVAQVLADPFNCLGLYSDAAPEACKELRFMVKSGPELRRAYKTPSLRGVADRPPYMHAGQIPTLEAVVDHYARAPKSREGKSEVVPLKLSESERAALVAFLKTLSN
ncbi:cytochrome-c peroxidase [Pseudaminobacter soli (ex Li et al. 2025)]|uniref:Methylamine utilization protein n=1 Tax=Pseudaminobacter soli (ex Li et al. 2025) TaxID=1295366 RepID=A0A2P7SN14_9HYPH|nr:cytochrome c peroxidase [Mesorhizobium soli]PSJ63884.1 methylamine utilization protein [Mesorhizobium soli]